MPRFYWPSRRAHIVILGSAYKHGVLEDDIFQVLALGTHELEDITGGHLRREGKSTIGTGYLGDGWELEVGLRQDNRDPEVERCIVYHACYLSSN